jgi:hypothetical protein
MSAAPKEPSKPGVNAGKARKADKANKAKAHVAIEGSAPKILRIGTFITVTHWDDFGGVEVYGSFYVPPEKSNMLKQLNDLSANYTSPGAHALVQVSTTQHTTKYVFSADPLKAVTDGMADIKWLVNKLLAPTVEVDHVDGIDRKEIDMLKFITYDEHTSFKL